MHRPAARLLALLAARCFVIVGGMAAPFPGDDMAHRRAQVHALPRAGSPLAPPDGAAAAYLAPEGGCLVTLTLVGGGGGGSALVGECAARARARARRAK